MFPSIFGVTPKDFENQLHELAKTGIFINQKDLIDNTDAVLNSSQNHILISKLSDLHLISR